MFFARTKLVFAVLAGSLSLAAAPAQAGTAASATSAAVGAIDVSKVAAEAQEGDDDQFQQLFARWESLDKPVAPTASMPLPKVSSVSVPSRNPLEGSRLTSGYGNRTHPVLGGTRAHKGIDLAAPTGTPIYATADGFVSKAEPFAAYGNYVAIEHGGDLQTRYAHMSRIVAVQGARVKKGDLIGYVGSTGRSTGPHLHYEVRVGGVAVNPVPYMNGSTSSATLARAGN